MQKKLSRNDRSKFEKSDSYQKIKIATAKNQIESCKILYLLTENPYFVIEAFQTARAHDTVIPRWVEEYYSGANEKLLKRKTKGKIGDFVAESFGLLRGRGETDYFTGYQKLNSQFDAIDSWESLLHLFNKNPESSLLKSKKININSKTKIREFIEDEYLISDRKTLSAWKKNVGKLDVPLNISLDRLKKIKKNK